VSSAFPKFEPLDFKPDEHKAKKSFSFGIPFSFWTFAKRKVILDSFSSARKKVRIVEVCKKKMQLAINPQISL